MCEPFKLWRLIIWSLFWLSRVNTWLQNALILVALELLLPLVIFHMAWCCVDRSFLRRQLVDVSRASIGSWLSLLTLSYPPINNPPSWSHARFCLKQSVLVPLSGKPGQSKGRGRQTELCSCLQNKMKHFRGQWGGPGHWVHLKWAIVLYPKSLQDHTASNGVPSDTHTYKSHIYLHLCFYPSSCAH